MLPRRLALVAAAALALDPASIVFANQMLTETLFALLVTVAVALLVCCYRSHSAVTAVAAGLTLGLAVLVRPIAEYLPLFIAVTLVLIGVREKTLRLLVPVTLAFVIGFAVPSGAWVLRNYELTGVPLISTIDGHNLLQYRAVGAMVEDGEPRSLAQHHVLVCLAPHVSPGDNAAEVSRAEARVGLSVLAKHPVGTLKTWRRGEAKLLFGPALADGHASDGSRDGRHVVAAAVDQSRRSHHCRSRRGSRGRRRRASERIPPERRAVAPAHTCGVPRDHLRRTRGIRPVSRPGGALLAVLGAATLTLGRRDPVAPPEPSRPDELPVRRLGRPRSLL